MKRSDFRFLEPLRVRWAEVDMQRVVFNAHYLTWFDTALGAYWRALALPYEETLAGLDGDLFVRRATLEYEAPARYDDALAIGIRFAAVGTSSLRFTPAPSATTNRSSTGSWCTCGRTRPARRSAGRGPSPRRSSQHSRPMRRATRW